MQTAATCGKAGVGLRGMEQGESTAQKSRGWQQAGHIYCKQLSSHLAHLSNQPNKESTDREMDKEKEKKRRCKEKRIR